MRKPRAPTALDRIDIRRERIGWLKSLCAVFESAHNWDADEDPSATIECLQECRALAKELEAELPAPPQSEAVPDDPTIPF